MIKKEDKKMKRSRVLIVFSMFFLCFMFLLSYALETKSKEMKPVTSSTISPRSSTSATTPILDLEAKIPVCTRRPLSGDTAVFIIGAKVCNVGTADFVSPPAEKAYVTLTAYQEGYGGRRNVVLGSQTITRLNKGQCININKTYEVRGVVKYYDGFSRISEPDLCKDQVSFFITIGRNPKISGRTYAYDYPDANTGNNIARRDMYYLIRCPR
jgi:hypothetical protein